MLYLMEVEIRISCTEVGSRFSCVSLSLTSLQLIFYGSMCCFAARSVGPSASVSEFSTKFHQTLATAGEWSQQSFYIAGYFIVLLINFFFLFTCRFNFKWDTYSVNECHGDYQIINLRSDGIRG